MRTLVGARVLEEDDLALLEVQARLLREEQVRALDDVLEMRLSLRIDQRGDVRDVHSLGTEEPNTNATISVRCSHALSLTALTDRHKARADPP